MERKSYKREAYGYRTWTGTVVNSSVPCQGWYQYISALNYGRFVRGQVRLNPVLISKTTYSASSGEGRVYYPYPVGAYSSAYGPIALTAQYSIDSSGPNLMGRPVFYWNEQLANLALVTAYSRMNTAEFWSAGTFLGELSETIGMLRKPFTGLRVLLRKKKFRDPRRLVNAGSDTLLEFRYGVRPLINEIATVAALFNKRADFAGSKLYSAKGFANASPRTWTGSTVVTVGDVSFPMIDRGTMFESYTSSVVYRKKAGFNATCHKYGLAIQDVPSVMWELTSLSFVVDWFLQVGPWLKAMTPNPSVTILGNSTTRKSSEQSSRVVSGNCYVSSYVGSRTSHRAHFEYNAIDRRVNSALPALPVRTINTLGFARSVDSLALLWQRLPSAWIRPR